MALDQLPAFLNAISAQESGHDYNAVGPYTGARYGRARGRWQIMETIWPGWAAEAGIPGASWADPEAQDRVVRHKMTQYYNRYGRWDLVAIAWFAGPGRANTAAEHGISAVGGLDDVLGTTVANYVQKAMSGMSGGRGGRLIEGNTASHLAQPNEQGVVEASPEFRGEEPDPNEEFEAAERMGDDTMANIITSISDAASAQGGKEIDLSGLFGSVLDDIEAEDELVEEVS